MLVLVDQDNVLADFDAAFRARWNERYPQAPFVSAERRRSWNPVDDLPAEYRAAGVALYSAQGFFRSLAPIAGAVPALQAMLELGWNVRICTAPIIAYHHCVREKFEWVEEHLGADWVRRIVLTADKTVVHGDWLIDDQPRVHGSRTPSWRHALFDRPHNRHVPFAPRIDWHNWRTVLTS
ncbi:MAG: 5'-3'-deoxyribonucleotidase [Gammaproteobacteria bacterium]|nr:5'-3'-deoxyribonucleotidase [Gammaproteobacteria bacterium]